MSENLAETHENPAYETVTNRIVEVQTPTSRTRFHDHNDRVEFEREKYENAKQKQERTVQRLHVVLPNSRGRR